jgi:dipeptidyl aminopeptidase/acylaminoacyl peptidase
VRAEPAPPWDLAVDGLEVRRVARAGLLLQAYEVGRPERTVIVQDADDGAFARVPYEPSLALTEALALSRDGRRIISLCRELSGAKRDVLVVRTLADGSETRFAEGADGGDLCAAFSPDGRSLAVLAATEVWAPEGHIEKNLLIVEILDPATGDRRRLWSGPGLAPAERAISWSPDGRFIAVVHLDPDEQFAVTVLDAGSGRLVRTFTEVEALGASQGAWLADHELVLFPEDFDEDRAPALILDVVTGASRRVEQSGELPHGCSAIGNGRMIGPFPAHGIGTADLDGGNPRLLLTHDPMTQVQVVDIAPDAAPLP